MALNSSLVLSRNLIGESCCNMRETEESEARQFGLSGLGSQILIILRFCNNRLDIDDWGSIDRFDWTYQQNITIYT